MLRNSRLGLISQRVGGGASPVNGSDQSSSLKCLLNSDWKVGGPRESLVSVLGRDFIIFAYRAFMNSDL